MGGESLSRLGRDRERREEVNESDKREEFDEKK